MKYVYTFNEIIRGRVELEADHMPNNEEIIEKIHEGKADYHDTDFTNFRLIEMDGETQNDGMYIEVDKAVAWEKYLKYLRGWADSHAEPVFYGTTPVCYDEWVDNEYHEEKINGIFEAGSCPKCGCDSLDYDGGDFVILGDNKICNQSSRRL